MLVEAKNSMPNDFVIRQLYYPYRFWLSKVKKELIPVFFVYDNGVYNMFIYKFCDINNYNSLQLLEIKRYMVVNKTSEFIKNSIFNERILVNELPQDIVPFPQADSFSKLLETLELIDLGFNTAIEISEKLGFNKRQGKYYIDALRYLNFVEKDNNLGRYRLTNAGKLVLISKVKLKNRIIIEQILAHKPFHEVYMYYYVYGVLPNKECIKGILKDNVPELSNETINRRASTIKSWIQWIIGATV